MRQQHYKFAHSVLPNLVLSLPSAFWDQFEQLGGLAIRRPWEETAVGLGPADRVEGTPHLQLVQLAGGARAYLITMPPPEDAAECHFIALVRLGNEEPRYFVCERGVDQGAGPRAYWAEWKEPPGGGGALMRVRGADLPAITPEAFLAAAVEEIRGSAGSGAPAPGPMGGPGAMGPFGAPMGAPAPGQWGPGPMGAPGPGQWGPGGPPMGPIPGPAKKKSKVPLFLGCGCLGLFLFVLTVGGTLLYFEEGKGLHVPDTEVATVPVTPGSPYSIDFVWDGTGYAFNNVWLVIEDGQKSGGRFEVKTTMTCSRGGREEAKTISVPSWDAKDVEDKGSSFSAWLYLGDEYERSSSRKITCSGTVTPTVGTWTRAHIAVTQRQRPADFFAF